MRLFINTQASNPGSASVVSASNPAPIPFPSVVAGNKVVYEVFLVDGAGNYETFSGDASYTVKLAIGDPASRNSLASVTGGSWASFSAAIAGVAVSGWRATLDLSGQAVKDYVFNLRSRVVSWELQITAPGGSITTYAQQDVEILNSIQ